MKDTAHSSEDTQLFYVPVDVVPSIWDDVARLLEKSVATAGGRFEVDDVRDRILQGVYLLWVATVDKRIVAALTTRIIEYPRRRALALDWIGGSQMRKWLPLAQKTMADYARLNGCEELEGYGRKEWGRALRAYGWQPHYMAFKMELTDGQ